MHLKHWSRLVLFLASLSAALLPGAYAWEESCEPIFSGRYEYHWELYFKGIQSRVLPENAVEINELRSWLKTLSPLEQVQLPSVLNRSEYRGLFEAQDTLEWPRRFHGLATLGAGRMKNILSILELQVKIQNWSLQSHKLNRYLLTWATTADRARFAYESLMAANDPFLKSKIIRFLDESPWFKDSIRMKSDPSLLVTFSFEKETRSEWAIRQFLPLEPNPVFQGPPITSVSGLHASGYRHLNLASPRYLNPRVDFEGLQGKGMMIELKSARYSPSFSEHKKMVQEIAKQTNESHSFHFHSMAHLDFTSQTAKDRFNKWIYQWNRYLVFLGLEERLFPQEMTKLPMHDTPFADGRKLLAAGVRLGFDATFGIKGKTFVSIELRDATRDLTQALSIQNQIAKDLSQEVWLQDSFGRHNSLRSLTLWEGDRTELHPDYPLHIAQFEEYFADVLSDEAKILLRLPFINFEEHLGLSLQETALITNARKEFIDGLEKLKFDLVKQEGPLSRTTDEAADSVIRWEIADWAQKVKISRYFKPQFGL